MNNITEIDLGNIGSKEQAEKIKKTLQGKTYMNFQVSYSSCVNNYPVIVWTDREGTTEGELKDMVLFYLACEI